MQKRWNESLFEGDSLVTKEIDKLLHSLNREDVYFVHFLLRNLKLVKGFFELIRRSNV